MTREQLADLAQQLGERRGGRNAGRTAAITPVAKRMVREILQRVDTLLPDATDYNVQATLFSGRAVLDIHPAGEPAGRAERERYNRLRAQGRSHEEAAEQMIRAMGIPADHVRPAVGQGVFARVTVPLSPGGRVYGRREALGPRNPNVAVEPEPAAD